MRNRAYCACKQKQTYKPQVTDRERRTYNGILHTEQRNQDAHGRNRRIHDEPGRGGGFRGERFKNLFLHQPTDNWREGYKQIEKAYKEGKVKAIGLSNFPEDLLQEAIDTMEIKPQVVQVEAHPYFPQTELKKILAKNNMGLMAWYPLGHGDKTLTGQPIFAELGARYGKSPAQIILRWHIQSGNVVIPGSKNPDHIRDKFDIFDFTLTDEEMAEIAKVDKGVRYYNGTPEMIAAYKTMELGPDL